jgi:hypothetical protein
VHEAAEEAFLATTATTQAGVIAKLQYVAEHMIAGWSPRHREVVVSALADLEWLAG